MRSHKYCSSDEAPDTGDDSDEDLVTNYLANATSTAANNGDALVPTIHITPQSPNGNHVLGEIYLLFKTAFYLQKNSNYGGKQRPNESILHQSFIKN